MRVAARLLLLLALLGGALLAWGYWTAMADPVVRRAEVGFSNWPAGAAPVRALLMSDIHVGGPDMPPERLARIVAQVNGLAPDLVLIAGDYVSDKPIATRSYTMAEAIAPLAALRPRLGTIAVMGNHDHWADPAGARAAMDKSGVRVLDNEAVAVGPLAIGGLDDDFTGHSDLPATLARVRATPGAKVILSHSPDPFAQLPGGAGLMLAGHTHCGQISLPLIGALETATRQGRRYACGVVREAGNSLIVTAGLGTSLMPLRLGAVPDMWLVTLGPERSRPPEP